MKFCTLHHAKPRELTTRNNKQWTMRRSRKRSPSPYSSTLTSVQLNNNAGCGSTAQPNKSTYGKSFNSNGGGIYATEWTSDHIKIWFFPRNSIPFDIRRGKPNPELWSKPQTSFQGSSTCDIDSHFANHKLIFDTTFCGDWAGGVWGNDGGICSQGGKVSCEQFVAGNPGAFRDAWVICDMRFGWE